MGIRSVPEDLQVHLQSRFLTDATTGKAIAMRRGIGKLRHLETTQLWVQERVERENIEIAKIRNTVNSADLLTKHLSQSEVKEVLENIECGWMEGRSDIAPTLVGQVDCGDITDIMIMQYQIKCYSVP